jgi:hypothetical protein
MERPDARAWAWRLNWYRQGELDGALVLGRAVRAAAEPELIAALTRHAAEEAEHSRLWSATLDELGLPHIRILRSYQSYYADEGAVPADLTQVLALTHVFERRVDRCFRTALADPHSPPPVRRTLEIMLDDERFHLAWIGLRLKPQPEAAALLARFSAADERVYRRLQPFENRLWEVPGLGVEPAAPAAVAMEAVACCS